MCAAITIYPQNLNSTFSSGHPSGIAQQCLHNVLLQDGFPIPSLEILGKAISEAMLESDLLTHLAQRYLLLKTLGKLDGELPRANHIRVLERVTYAPEIFAPAWTLSDEAVEPSYLVLIRCTRGGAELLHKGRPTGSCDPNHFFLLC